ncbi:hypothetical protein [Streptomyces sirii]|uniref:hypothetical protein n=1 Tax=Streptomyces sirii TaxID=3127701 RepID=UPI003D36087A
MVVTSADDGQTALGVHTPCFCSVMDFDSFPPKRSARLRLRVSRLLLRCDGAILWQAASSVACPMARHWPAVCTAVDTPFLGAISFEGNSRSLASGP